MRQLLPSLFIIASALCCGACSFGNGEHSGPTRSDSVALRVAILPTQECDSIKQLFAPGEAGDSLPFYVQFVQFDALLDVDTALVKGYADVFFEDSVRIAQATHIPDSLRHSLQKIIDIPHKMYLVANYSKRVRKVMALKECMVATPRWSTTENWLTEVIDSVSAKSEAQQLEQTDIYRAQINSIPVRYKMVKEGLVDAAILSNPWADSLANEKHRLLATKTLSGYGFYVTNSTLADSAMARRIETFKKVVLRQNEK